jgi:hypothetical protein
MIFLDSKAIKRLWSSLKSLELEKKVANIFMSQTKSNSNLLDLEMGYETTPFGEH